MFKRLFLFASCNKSNKARKKTLNNHVSDVA